MTHLEKQTEKAVGGYWLLSSAAHTHNGTQHQTGHKRTLRQDSRARPSQDPRTVPETKRRTRTKPNERNDKSTKNR